MIHTHDVRVLKVSNLLYMHLCDRSLVARVCFLIDLGDIRSQAENECIFQL